MTDASSFLIKSIAIDSVSYQKFQLHPALREVVEYGWLIRNNQPQKIPDIHISDGQMEVVFVLEGTYTKQSVTDETDNKLISGSCIVGIQTKSYLVRGLEKLSMMGVKFTPLGFSLLFGNKVYHSKDNNIGFDDFGEDWLWQLQEKIQKRATLPEVIEELSQAILCRLGQVRTDDSLTIANACLQTIVAEKGVITVRQLSERHHKSMRQIQRYFVQHFDVSPKQFIKIIRFKDLYRQSILRKMPPTEYLEYGYFDQAHFVREFHRQTGVTPSRAVEKDFLEKNRIAEVNLM